MHDVILYYARSEAAVCHPNARMHSAEYLKKFSKLDPATDKYFQDVELTGPGIRHGPSGQPWRGINPTAKNRHWQPASYVYEKYKEITGDDLANYELIERLDKLDEAGLIYWTKNGKPRYKLFLEDAEESGAPIQDVWTDIPAINSQADEATGYPTQKPLTLLERIISASSDEGQLVLDPFCGCGTAIVAAQRLKRRWVGIDITHVAVSVLKQRIDREFPGLPYRVRGEPSDVASARKLADEKWDEFQAWIVDRVGGIPLNPTEEKKVAKKGKDHGIDGLLLFRDDPKAARSRRMILSVKAGKTLTPEMVNALYGVMAREGAPMGALLVAHKPSKGVYNEAGSYAAYRSEVYQPGVTYPAIQVVTVEDIFADGWRGLQFPGMNTTRTSQPPPLEHPAPARIARLTRERDSARELTRNGATASPSPPHPAANTTAEDDG